MTTALQIVQRPDLGAQRKLSPDTLKAFHVRHNGTGWEYDYQTMSGATATRWKSYLSIQPDDDPDWSKYRFSPKKPADARYFYPVGHSLKDAIKAAAGLLYLVGGEIGVMAMWEAGIRNVTCTFGDRAIEPELLSDLQLWGVEALYLIPDRDDAGQKWAIEIRKRLASQLEIEFEALALPYTFEKSHGQDIADFWKENANKSTFRELLANLPTWRLPEPEPEQPPDLFSIGEAVSIPYAFTQAIENALGVTGGYNGDGWSKRHVCCPFHDDKTPSANWNRDKNILRCQSACGRSYLAKDVGEKFGLRLTDYLDSTPGIPLTTRHDAPQATQAPVVAPTPAKAPVKRLAPPLPLGVALTEAQELEAANGREWLDGYLDYTKQACPLSPDIFHEAMALWLLATVSTRRMKISIGGEDIYPNLYVLIVAKTSLYRKSTAMKEAKKLLKLSRLESLLLPSDVTPEALFDELAGVKPANFDVLSKEDRDGWLQGRAVAAQRSVMKDEASSIFANLRKEYMAGLTELLLQGYDGDAGKLTKQLKSKGLISIRDMCLSFLGATTPVMYSKYIGTEESENGFIARFAVVTPEAPPEYRITDEPVDVPPRLVQRLRALFMDVLPWHGGLKPSAATTLGEVVSPPVVSVSIAPDAIRALTGYRKALGYDMLVDETVDDGKAAAYTRLGTMAYKVGMLLAAIDTDSAPVRIEPRHAYAAIQICERWRESLHRLDGDIAKATYGGSEEKILSYLKSAGSLGAPIRLIMRDCSINPKQKVVEALSTLAEAGLIEKYSYETGKPGANPIHFRLIQGD